MGRRSQTTWPLQWGIIAPPFSIRDVLGFHTEISVPDGMKELKDAIRSGRISDLDAPRYSNHLTVRDLAFD